LNQILIYGGGGKSLGVDFGVCSSVFICSLSRNCSFNSLCSSAHLLGARASPKWIGHILYRNCLLEQVIEGKIKGGIEVTGRPGRRRRKVMDDLKEESFMS
jgi:hypothetical protein